MIEETQTIFSAFGVGLCQVAAVERDGGGGGRRGALHLGPRQPRGHAQAAPARAERRPPLLRSTLIVIGARNR